MIWRRTNFSKIVKRLAESSRYLKQCIIWAVALKVFTENQCLWSICWFAVNSIITLWNFFWLICLYQLNIGIVWKVLGPFFKTHSNFGFMPNLDSTSVALGIFLKKGRIKKNNWDGKAEDKWQTLIASLILLRI